jgi:hypothetical protein
MHQIDYSMEVSNFRVWLARKVIGSVSCAKSNLLIPRFAILSQMLPLRTFLEPSRQKHLHWLLTKQPQRPFGNPPPSASHHHLVYMMFRGVLMNYKGAFVRQ